MNRRCDPPLISIAGEAIHTANALRNSHGVMKGMLSSAVSARRSRLKSKLIGAGAGRLKKIGETETGTVYEQSFRLPDYEGQSLKVRRIVVKLKTPTRDGDTEIAILTNIPQARADAVKIAEVYRLRWKIETAFQHLTDVLSCEVDALCDPKAALVLFRQRSGGLQRVLDRQGGHRSGPRPARVMGQTLNRC